MPHKPYKTQLIYVEGPDESAFIGYLKKYPYEGDIRGCGMKSDIIVAPEGSCQDILNEALKRKNRNGFDRVVIVMDYDWMGSTPTQRENQLKTLERQVKDKGADSVLLIVNKPCLEGLLLSILEDDDFFEYDDGCDPLKNHFQKHYLNKKKRKVSDNYTKFFRKNGQEKSFSKEKIEVARSTSSSLDSLIKAMKNEV